MFLLLSLLSSCAALAPQDPDFDRHFTGRTLRFDYNHTGTATEEHILVDQQTESVVWTRQYRWGAETERLKWSEVAKLEYVVRSGGYEVAAIAMNGDRFVIHEAVAPLKTTADQYAAMMEKPLDIVDQTRGFHKMD